MKCKKCGHRANSLQAMQKHYRKAHPGAMKRKKKAETVRLDNMATGANEPHRGGVRYCPRCGERIGG